MSGTILYMQLVVDNRVVGYDRMGSGKRVVLLLHGWGANRQTMVPVAHMLDTKKYDIIMPDVPGFGESEKPDAPWGLLEYAEWVKKLLEKLHVSSVYGLVGHSNGGAIAIKLVSVGWVQPDKLILLGASGVRNREKGKKLFFKAVAKAGRAGTVMLPGKVKRGLRSKWYKKIGSELYDNPGLEQTFKKVTSEDLVVEAAMISVPTLLVYGAEDRATPPVYGRVYHEVIEGSQLMIVEGAGHYAFIDKPSAVEQALHSFL